MKTDVYKRQIQNLDPKIFKSKNQFIIDAIQFYIDNY